MTQSDNNVKIEYLPLSELIPYEKNPRKNDRAVDIVANSIKEFGFRNPILIDKNNIIIAGHTRLKAALKLGISQVPVIWIDDLTPAQIKAYRIMDNKSTEYADWNFELLTEEFKGLKDENFDLSLTGFSESELDKIFPQSLDEESLPDIDKPKYEVKRGDIWQLGRHRLMCGDCTDNHEVSLLFNNTEANCILTDPPYGVDYSEKNKWLNTIAKGNRNQKPIENDKNIDVGLLLSQCLSNAILTKNNTVYVFTSGKHIADFIQAFSKAGFYYSQDLKWIKNNHVLGRLDYNPKSENILYGWKGKHEFYGGFQTDVLYFDKPLKSKEHPTMKPIELLKTLLSHGSRENSIVYDGFGGSGSTLIACEQTNRIAYLMELDPLYCSVILERYQNLTKKEPTKLTK